MPNSPRTPSTASRRIDGTGKASFPIPASVSTLPAGLGTLAQVAAYHSTMVMVGIPAIAANAMTIVTSTVQLIMFPQPIVVPNGWTALIISSATPFDVAALSGIIIGMPGVAFINNGFPQSTLLGPGNYTAPALKFTIPVHAPSGAYAGGMVQLTVWAVLLASPA